jgi:hypothetical protein
VRTILAQAPDSSVRSLRAISLMRDPAFHEALARAGMPE